MYSLCLVLEQFILLKSLEVESRAETGAGDVTAGTHGMISGWDGPCTLLGAGTDPAHRSGSGLEVQVPDEGTELTVILGRGSCSSWGPCTSSASSQVSQSTARVASD